MINVPFEIDVVQCRESVDVATLAVASSVRNSVLAGFVGLSWSGSLSPLALTQRGKLISSPLPEGVKSCGSIGLRCDTRSPLQ